MQRFRTALLTLAVAASGVLLATPAASAEPLPPLPPLPYYLALGDSLAQGVQFVPGAGPVPTDRGYVDHVGAAMQVGDPSVQVVKLGCPGESTTEMLFGGGNCDYPAGSQLAQAVALISGILASGGTIAGLTIDVGSSDVLDCTDQATLTIDQICAAAAIATVGTNLPIILSTLKSVLPKGTRKAGMTYYDVGVVVYPQKKELAKVSVRLTRALNGVLIRAYWPQNFKVAEVFKSYQSKDFRRFPGTSLPTNFVVLCQLTYMCDFTDPHPNDEGYAVIAAAFLKVLKLPAPGSSPVPPDGPQPS